MSQEPLLRTHIPEASDTGLLDRVTSPVWWRSHFPELTLRDDQPAAEPSRETAGADLDRMAVRMQHEGYFRGEHPVLRALAPSLAKGVERLHELGLPPCFLFVFDEAWMAFWGLHGILRETLGDNYRALPAFWTWRVDPAEEEAGWTPHRDMGRRSLRPDGTPLAATVWIPLTRADPMNGCMYIVPADRDPVYNTDQEHTFAFALPDIRALPADPGEFLCWNQAVMHWGARSCRFSEQPRISMALEFQRGDVGAFKQPLIQPGMVLPFLARLKLTAMQILNYQHMYALKPELKAAAEAIQRMR